MGTSKLRSIACIVLPILIFFFFDKMNGARASLVFPKYISYAFLEEVGSRIFNRRVCWSRSVEASFDSHKLLVFLACQFPIRHRQFSFLLYYY